MNQLFMALAGEIKAAAFLVGEVIEQRIGDNPEDAEAWFMLGRANMARNNFEQAVQAFRRSNALLDDEPSAKTDFYAHLIVPLWQQLALSPTMALDFWGDRPQGRMISRTAGTGCLAMSWGLSARSNRAGVTWFTLSSVHWALSRTATSKV